MNKTFLAGFLIALVGAVLFSTKAIIVKLAFAHTTMDALTLLTLRMLFSLPFYLAAAWIGSAQSGETRFTRKQWVTILSLGLFGYYLSSLFDFMGLQYISAGLERLILFLYPSFALLINRILFKERISGLQLGALALTYAGIAIAYFGELDIQKQSPHLYWGSFLVFLCSITYATYIVGSGRMVKTIAPAKFTAYAMLASTAGVFAHFLIAGNRQDLETAVTHWGYGLSLAILATVIPTFLLSWAIKKIGANNVAIISAIGPVSTIIQAYLVLGEKIFAAQLFGTALVIIGVLLIGWKTKQGLEDSIK
jgi:drug/metabolite transporter (DMT)-like permease